MFVMGIDPGLTRCGYGCIELPLSGKPRAVSAGILKTSVDASLPDRLATLYDDLCQLLSEYQPDAVAVEKVFFQTNVRTAMSVGQASGLALVAAQRASCEVAEYTANEVEVAITGYGAATKVQMQRMVQVMLGLSERPDPPDAADALALALCHSTLGDRTRRMQAGTRS